MHPVFLTLGAAAEAYTSFTERDDPKSCHIVGDKDIYGLVVRLGFYLNYLTTIIAIWLDPDATGNARTQINVFSIAVPTNTHRTANWEGSLVMLEFSIVANMTVILTFGTVMFM